jgi:hypothetical protein
MTKDDFLKLNKQVGQLPPDESIINQYLEKQFSDLGLSTENGYKAVQFFYNELCKAKSGETSVFKGKVVTTDEYFGIVGNTCYFKMFNEDFDNRRAIYFPPVATVVTKQATVTRFKHNNHEQLMLAFVYSAGESNEKPIEGAYERLLELWYFIHSDKALLNGDLIEKDKRPLFVNPTIVGKNDFSKYLNASISFDGKRNNIKLTESDFITETFA